jgi:hypothetical protein
MPWSVSDVDSHKKGLSAREKRQWVTVANSVLAKCLADGGSDKICAPKAIRQANGVAGNEMAVHQLQAAEYVIRNEQHQGHPNIVVPIVLMVEGVHSGSHGPLFHSAEELGRFVQTWNGIPVVIQHPEREGVNVSANSPDIIDEQTVGRIYNAYMDGPRLRAEAWIDLARITEVSPETLAIIQAQRRLDVSVGVFSEDELTPGNWNGEEYVGIARGHRPDHLALLPGGQGACSWEDGCGVRANAEEGGTKPLGNKAAEKVVEEDDEEEVDEIENDATCAGGDGKKKKKKDVQADAVEKVPTLFELFKKLTTNGYTVMQTNAELGYRERMSKVQSVLDAMDNNDKMHFLQEVYDDTVVYEVMTRQGGPPLLYRQTYEVNDKGEVMLTGVATSVIRQVSFVVANNPQTNSDKGGKTMPEEKKKCCPEKVQALIASEHAPFEEADREWLETLDQPQIDKLVTMERNAAVKPVVEPVTEPEPVTNEQAVQVLREQLKTPEQFIQLLPDEMREQMTSALTLHKSEKAKLIETIKSASSFTDDELKTKTMAELSKLSEMAKPRDYSGKSGGSPMKTNDEDNLLLPPGVEYKQEGGKS